MFKYADNDLHKKLEILENKYEKTALESEKILDKRMKLENYIFLMNNFIDACVLLIISFAAFCMSLLATNAISILFAVISIVECGMVVANRKLLKKNYSEFLHEKKVFNLKSQLEEQEKNINQTKQRILSKIEECNKELQVIDKLKNESFDLKVICDNPYYLADTKEEFYSFKHAKENGSDNLLNVYWDNFFNQKINPTLLHNYKKIGENKKLMKKM